MQRSILCINLSGTISKCSDISSVFPNFLVGKSSHVQNILKLDIFIYSVVHLNVGHPLKICIFCPTLTNFQLLSFVKYENTYL